MTYMGHAYYPWWLDNMADDVTSEGAALQGVVHGAENVRTVVLAARDIYQDQEISFTGDFGDDGFIELYTCRIDGEPTRVVATITRNDAGRATSVVVNHRPRSSVLAFARLMGEKFAGTPLAEYFITPPEQDAPARMQEAAR